MKVAMAGSVALAVPHVAGFASSSTAWRQPPDPRLPGSSFPRHEVAAVTTRVQSMLETSWPSLPPTHDIVGSAVLRRRAWLAHRSAASRRSTHLNMTSTSTRRQDGHQGSSRSGLKPPASAFSAIRLAIVGHNADELGRRVARDHGLVAISISELMEGRKGRKTDLVRAKAVARWSAGDASAGRILTGFPMTIAQAELLEGQGVEFEGFIVVHEATESGKSDGFEEYDTNLPLRHVGKTVKLVDDGDEDGLSASVARVLAVPADDSSECENDLSNTAGSSAESAEGTRLASSVQERGIASDGGTEVTLESTQEMSAKGGRRVTSAGDDPVTKEAAAEAAKIGAEAKRARKEAAKRKRKEANEAQQLDTPFYVAVAQGKPKARFRPPAPTIPSRITERLSSAAEVSNTRLDFGPLALESPASDCLSAVGIREPTGIQEAGMGPILEGDSVILHAMTGSGKTLAFLLPLMQRWAPGFLSSDDGIRIGVDASVNGPNGAFQVLLALPTRELAVQVAREAVLLAGGVTASVELFVESRALYDLSSVTAPIVVGSAKILERVIRKSHPRVRAEALSRVKAIVVDEVDRLVDVLSKHAPPKEVEKRKRHARPIAALLQRIIQARPDVQIIACSATIGRPLRRELSHVIRRASVTTSSDASVNEDVDDQMLTRGELRIIRDPREVAAVGDLAIERAVSIPSTIRHYCVPLQGSDFFSRLEALTEAVRELQPRRPLIFVPPNERVTAVVAHLRRAGGEIGRGAVALHEAMGFVSDEAGGGVRGSHTSEAIQQHDKLARQFGDALDTGELAQNTFADGAALHDPMERGHGTLLVTGEESARGLHFDDVDFVFLMQKPRSPDEYVHLAGRTGRQGRTGSVVSLLSFEDFRKLQAWSSTLKIHLEPLDILNVVKR